MATHYDDTIARSLEDPQAAFRASLDSSDSAELAILAILDPDIAAPKAAERLAAIAEYRGSDEVISALALGILAHADRLTDELVEGARQLVRSHWKDLPLTVAQGDQVAAMVRDQDIPDDRRVALLLWLWGAHSDEAYGVAAEIVPDTTEPYGATTRQAIIILTDNLTDETRSLLQAYAERQFEPPSAAPPAPQPHPEASLYVLNRLAQPGESEMALIRRVLGLVAERALPVEKKLDRLIESLTLAQIRELVEYLEQEGHTGWSSNSLFPSCFERGGPTSQTPSLRSGGRGNAYQ